MSSNSTMCSGRQAKHQKVGNDDDSFLVGRVVDVLPLSDYNSSSLDNSHYPYRQNNSIPGINIPPSNITAYTAVTAAAVLTIGTNTVDETMSTESKPTARNISLALSRIDDTDEYRSDETMKALDDFLRWGYFADKTFIDLGTKFIDYGGIPRILIFIKENLEHPKSIIFAAEILEMFLEPGENNIDCIVAVEVAKKIIEHDGIKILLYVNEEYNGQVMNEDVRIISSIWKVIGNIFYHKNVVNIAIDKERIISLLNSGVYTIHKYNIVARDNPISSFESKFSYMALPAVFKTLEAIVHNSGSIDTIETIEGNGGDLKEINMFNECIHALKSPFGSWRYPHDDSYDSASRFFYYCCFTSDNNNNNNNVILSRKTDFELIVPFLIHYMKTFHSNRMREFFIFTILRKAIDVIGKEEMNKNKGLIAVLEEIADPVSERNEDVEEDTINEARELMEYFVDKKS